MSNHQAWQSGEDVQVLDNALSDSPMPDPTRKALLRRASAGLLGAGALGTLLAACGGGSSSSSSSSSASSSAAAAAPSTTSSMSTSSSSATGTGDIQTIINTAITAEALAVTYLTAVIKQAHGTPVAKFTDVLKAANAQEYDHYKVLKSLGAKPLTEKFWAPNAFFGPHLSGVFPTLEVAETLFVNAYLIHVTATAKAGMNTAARYGSEILGTEAQHLALARFAAGKLPNNLGFTDYSITSIDGIVAALEKAGVGFGKQGTQPGQFVTFAPPPASAVLPVGHTKPE